MFAALLTTSAAAALPLGTLVTADAKAVAARGAACLDGSPPAFYVWPGAEVKKHILFLEGASFRFHPYRTYRSHSPTTYPPPRARLVV
jgi:hypothetical protein